ncbi:hypothetical protein CB0940_07962 [Cercospora beticola]|uniref:Uncharacterized protein n=1 Tax=Cercospora beticola TaxID=122368 RepID=A0A2G5H863_CERBT|nr:hypothetical protein CB0940_07962 [Cercospora beticola]PIA88719.1 hypothetical protein CB0940_07962 [Cercospora beticola]WPB08544.1 hypothetical protein RHO25_013210 [Cercospora beticola]
MRGGEGKEEEEEVEEEERDPASECLMEGQQTVWVQPGARPSLSRSSNNHRAASPGHQMRQTAISQQKGEMVLAASELELSPATAALHPEEGNAAAAKHTHAERRGAVKNTAWLPDESTSCLSTSPSPLLRARRASHGPTLANELPDGLPPRPRRHSQPLSLPLVLVTREHPSRHRRRRNTWPRQPASPASSSPVQVDHRLPLPSQPPPAFWCLIVAAIILSTVALAAAVFLAHRPPLRPSSPSSYDSDPPATLHSCSTALLFTRPVMIPPAAPSPPHQPPTHTAYLRDMDPIVTLWSALYNSSTPASHLTQSQWLACHAAILFEVEAIHHNIARYA